MGILCGQYYKLHRRIMLGTAMIQYLDPEWTLYHFKASLDLPKNKGPKSSKCDL